MATTTAPETTSPTSPIGRDTPRIDGRLKVTGAAQYTSDFHFPGQLYAVPVEATIASGRIAELDASAAEAMPNVRAVLHRKNIGKLYRAAKPKGFDGITDERRPPFADDVIRYYGQYVAVAIADTFETAKAAADAVRVRYAKDVPNVSPELAVEGGAPDVDSERGDPEKAFAAAAVTIDATYVTPVETHNPIELHATTALWDGDRLTVYEATQAVHNARTVVAQMLGVPRENVRIVSRFLGSGFGGKLWPWSHTLIAAAAARVVGRPVKLVLSRKMMFQAVGHRPRTVQRVRVAADRDGKLVSLQHDVVNHTSMLDDYKEDCGESTPMQYSVPNLRVTSGLARRHVGSPTSMRGPGRVPGLYATESALNELAVAAGIDPVALRIKNEPAIDEGKKRPFSSRHLVECFTVGAERFGWAKRDPEVGAMRRDGLTLGWGMAGASWIAARFPAAATVELNDDGSARVACGTQDIGTGTYTILAQLVAEKTGVPLEKIEVVLGDTTLPEGPISGGSMATGSLVPAVFEAAEHAVASLLATATKTEGSPFTGTKPGDLTFEGGRVRTKDGKAAMPFPELLTKAEVRRVAGKGSAKGTFDEMDEAKVSTHSYGAHFVEVTWQPSTARLRVSRVVTVIDAGRIVNTLAGRNQIEGAVVMGIGMALFEETAYDPRYGAPINSSLADYVVAVNADVPSLDVTFLDFPDMEINAIGARGIGEIGLAGIAAAITDAVHHATGVRVRELPVKIEHLLA
jgi:xanthine dehydrogenase YagR molybdenum-binding subunit